MRGKARHIHNLVHPRLHGHNLRRMGKPGQQRPDHRAAGQARYGACQDMRGMDTRHDQHIGRPRQTSEGVQRGTQRGIQRDIGGHFTIEFKIRATFSQQLHRFTNAARDGAARIAKG